MNEQQLKHILISAATIGDDNEIIVLGSQYSCKTIRY